MPVIDVSGDKSQCAAQISDTVTPGVRRFVYVAYQCDWSEDIWIWADDSITWGHGIACRKSYGNVKMEIMNLFRSRTLTLFMNQGKFMNGHELRKFMNQGKFMNDHKLTRNMN